MKATTYIIPFEYSGLCQIVADSPEAARDLFEALSDDERLNHADFWADRTFTEEEYRAAIAATTSYDDIESPLAAKA